MWPCGTNSRLPFGINVNLNLSRSSINQNFLKCMLTDTKNNSYNCLSQ